MGLSDRETNSVFSTLTDNSPQLNLRPTYTIRVLVACGLEYCCLLILKKKSTAVCKPCAFRETKDWSVFMQRGEQIGHSNPHFDSQMYCCWWWSVSLKSTCSVSCCKKNPCSVSDLSTLSSLKNEVTAPGNRDCKFFFSIHNYFQGGSMGPAS